jgi:BirA family biotin operon repressor/biotin-[acetyl-CoA-carboxylase] ligase
MTRLAAAEKFLALLVAHPGGVSTDVVRAGLGAAMDDAAAALRARGHALDATGDTWRLACARDHFDPAAFEAARLGRWGVPCEVWEVAESTNDLAREAALRGAPDGAVWLAERQTAGRGRQGRNWKCAAHAGLLASWVVRASLAPETRPTLLPLVVGLGICEGLRAVTGLPVAPKWPNDLWLEGAKVAGILVEARPGPEGFAVVGMGLNVLADASFELAVDAPAACLRTSGAQVRRERLLAAVLAGAERRVDEWRAGRNAEWLERWLQLDMTQGRSVQLECAGELVSGRAVGVSASGCLRIEVGAGEVREFAAGEVHLS